MSSDSRALFGLPLAPFVCSTEMHQALSTAVGAGPCNVPHDDTSILYIRLLGALILSLAALPIHAIALANDAACSAYAQAHGVWRVVLAVALTALLVLGTEQARIAVPFLLHSLWVGASLSLSGGGPVGAYSALRSLASGRARRRLEGATEGAAPGT